MRSPLGQNPIHISTGRDAGGLNVDSLVAQILDAGAVPKRDTGQHEVRDSRPGPALERVKYPSTSC